MSGFYTEADYENSIIELFQNMGYRHVYGPDVERDFYSPLYEECRTAEAKSDYAGGCHCRCTVQTEKL